MRAHLRYTVAEYDHALGKHLRAAAERLKTLDHHICELRDTLLPLCQPRRGKQIRNLVAHLLLTLLEAQARGELHKVLVDACDDACD